ncbi:nucleotidyltransferase domain-containing protein [Ruminococcaceae bacterium OttesenSCG-928-L11]|nr:nucleotidyltransferase domain-containing protein [Ruminococcaceae bacterium OttesenSCG-928-L11]
MDQQVKQELNVITDIITKTVPVEQIYLFGSYANGTPHSDSDLDIYVVAKDSVADCMEASVAIRKAIRDRKTMSVDIVVDKHSTFQRRKTAPTMERMIAREGVVLYG